LPKISGIEVLQRIKAEKRTKKIPVIVLTSSALDQNIIECGRLGAENYILKPLSFESLSKETPKLKYRWALLRPDQAGLKAE
jgi:CheY-like chemotaxis protein